VGGLGGEVVVLGLLDWWDRVGRGGWVWGLGWIWRFGLWDFGSGVLLWDEAVEGFSRSKTRHTGKLPRAESMYDQVYGGSVTASKYCPHVGRC